MTEINKIWEKVLIIVRELITVAPYDIYIKTLKPISYEDDLFILLSDNNFNKDMIDKKYIDRIEKGFMTVLGEYVEVKIVLQNDLDENINFKAMPTDNTTYSEGKFFDKFVFDTFVSGKNSEFAYVSATQVAKNPGLIFNPLFIWGGVGLGKTHLMYAIYNDIKKNFPNMKVLYCTSEEFTNEFIASIGRGHGHNNTKDATSKFRTKYREADVLLIDDIQFLIGKEGTQEELFHTFNALKGANKQVVISSDQPPNKMKLLEERLSSRFSQGLPVDISIPDFETRVAILKKKAQFDNLVMPDDVINYMAENITSNIRELEGALTRVSAYSKISTIPINLSICKDALKDIINKPTKQEITIPYIQEIVANHFDISIEDLRGKKRPANISHARHVAMYLSHKHTDTTLVHIGKNYFGGRDHSTVSHAIKTIGSGISTDENIKETILEIENKIKL